MPTTPLLLRAIHHSSLSYGLVLGSSAKQMPGKAVPLCYNKRACTLSYSNKREGPPQEQQELSEATSGMLGNKAYFYSLTCLKAVSTLTC